MRKNSMRIKKYFTVCKNLVLSDLTVFKQQVVDKTIDISVWVILTMIVTEYVMPFFGLSNFGLFQFGGIIAGVGLFELYASIVDLVADLEGDRVINYNLTLPMPSVFALMSKSVYYFIIYSALTFAMLPVGYLCLWGKWQLAYVCYYKLLLTVLFQSMFFACFVLWGASVVDNMAHLGKIWSRFIFPMWFMGGFQFSWFSLYQAMPVLAYVNVINPMIYITESVRVALLGQEGYANFWLCLGVIAFFSVVCFTIGFYNLKKRLDFV